MQNTTDSYKHITATKGVLGGKPHIAGRRISVRDVVIWHEHFGQSAGEISSNYGLELTQVYAALAYYFDNRKEVDISIARADAFDAMLQKHSSPEHSSRSENSAATDKPGSALRKHAGTISKGDLRIMQNAISHDCEQIDHDGW